MLNMKFILISNNETVIEEEIRYIKKENDIVFKIEDTIYNLDVKNKIISKKDKESKMKMDFNNKTITITLLENNYTIDCPIKIIKDIFDDKRVEIEYTIEDGEVDNKIIIDY